MFLSLSDYDYISLHGGEDAHSQSEFDKSSTIPRNSDLSLNYRKMFQSKRPASTVSLLMDPEPIGPHTATIRRKPSSKPNIRRGTISGGVPIPISTPQVLHLFKLLRKWLNRVNQTCWNIEHNLEPILKDWELKNIIPAQYYFQTHSS